MVFLQRGGVCIRFALGRCCLFPFSSVCSFVSLRFCVGLHCLVFGSELTVVFVGVACDELSGNKQMAHSQIVVVIAFSFAFDMDVVFVYHRRPFGNICFPAIFQLPCTIICSGMLSFVFVCFDRVAYYFFIWHSFLVVFVEQIAFI